MAAHEKYPPPNMADPSKYSKVGSYILMETIGVGSFGKVKLAVHEKTYHRFACKILEKSLVRERLLSLQVQKEIEIMERLSHRNTVSLVSVLSSSQKVFIIMELVTGGELFDEILRHKRLSEPYARFYFRQLMEGLQHCHEHGVFHRDLKPENLLLDENHTLKITDFGLSTLKAGPSSGCGDSVTSSLTLHTQCGTPNYVAPEIITLDGDGYSGAKVDAWSCGIILYVLVAGALPFDANEMDVLFKLIIRCDLTYPSFFSPELVDLISHLLKTNPAERYSIADVMRHPWYNGPVENSMPVDEPAPPQAASVPAPASLLASSVLTSRGAQGFPDTDSLDFGVRVELAECELPIQSDEHPASSSIPNAITHDNTTSVTHSNSDSIRNEQFEGTTEASFTQNGLLPSETVSEGPHASEHPIDHPPASNATDSASSSQSKVLEADSEAIPEVVSQSKLPMEPMRPHGELRLLEEELAASYVHSSDDDHDYDMEEAREVRAPDGFFGPKQGAVRDQAGRNPDLFIRRVCSLDNMAKSDHTEQAIPACSVKMEHTDGYVGMRGRVKRHLWDRAAKTWQIPSQSHYPAAKPNVSMDMLEAINSLKQQGLEDTSESGLRVQSALRKSRSASGDNAHDFVKLLEEAESLEAKNGYGAARKPQHGGLVHTRSYHGPMSTAPTRRRPRHRPEPEPRAVMDRVEPALDQKRKQGVMPQSVLRNPGSGPRSAAAAARKRRGAGGQQTVRFRQQDRERLRKGSSFRPDKDWVNSDSDKMVWCRLMKDFDMVPDELEFEMDSATLSDMWQKKLAQEDLGRKNSFAATRFGSPTFVPSRSTVALSSAARQTQPDSLNTTSVNSTGPVSAARRLEVHRSKRANTGNAIVGAGARKRRTSPVAMDSLHSVVQEGSDLRNGNHDMNHVLSGRPKHVRTPVQATERPRPVVPKILEDEIRPNLTSSTHPRTQYIQGTSEPSAPSPLVKEPLTAGLHVPGRVHPFSTQNGMASVHDDDSFARRKIFDSSSPPGSSSGRMSPAYVMRSANSGHEPMANDANSGAIMHKVNNTWTRSADGSTGSPGDGNGMQSSRLVGTTVSETMRSVEDVPVVDLLQHSADDGRRPESGAEDHDKQNTPSHRSANGHFSRSDGRSLASDWGTGSSGPESTSSPLLRSGGSDGTMSSPRDPEKSYVLHVMEDHIHPTLSSGASSNGSEANTSRKNSGTKSAELRSSLARGTPAIQNRAEGNQAVVHGSTGIPSPGTVSPHEILSEPVSPFSVDIPGPEMTALPTANPIIGVLAPTVSTAKRFLKKNALPLGGKCYTQFHSLLDPSRCYEVMLELLRAYGCTVKGTPLNSGKFKIKCESSKGSSAIVATISLYKLDDLCVVMFKKRSTTDSQKFTEFYEAMHKMYCERSNDANGHSGRNSSEGERRRHKRFVHFQTGSLDTGMNTLTTQSVRSGHDSSMRTESSDSGISAKSNTRKNVV